MIFVTSVNVLIALTGFVLDQRLVIVFMDIKASHVTYRSVIRLAFTALQLYRMYASATLDGSLAYAMFPFVFLTAAITGAVSSQIFVNVIKAGIQAI